MHTRVIRMFLGLAKYYETEKPRTFNYRQSIFVAAAIGAAVVPPTRLSVPNLLLSRSPTRLQRSIITTIALEYGILFIPLNYSVLIDKIDFLKFILKL